MRKILIMLLVAVAVAATAQTERFALYRYNTQIINPALMALGNEQTYYLAGQATPNFDAPVGLLGYSNRIARINSGVGLILATEKVGALKNTEVDIRYNYQLNITENSKFVIGTSFNSRRLKIDFSKYRSIDSGDLSLYGRNTSYIYDFDLGALYQVNYLQVSVGAKNMMRSTHDLGIASKTRRLYNVFISNQYQALSWLKITPSVVYQSDFNDRSFLAINAMVELNDFLFIGVSEEFDSEYVNTVFTGGFNIKDKVQLLVLMYTGNDFTEETNLIEVMVKVKLKKKQRRSNTLKID